MFHIFRVLAHYLEVAPEQERWFNARDYCIGLGARLAEVRSQSQFDTLVNIAREMSESLWLGGQYDLEDGVWRWLSDGALVDEERRFWGPDQPGTFADGQSSLLL